MTFRNRIFAGLIAIGLLACGGGGGGSGGGGGGGNGGGLVYDYVPPADTGDGWATGGLAEEGFDVARVEAMMTRVLTGSFQGIDSVAIVRNEKLLLYWFDAGREFDEFDAWIGNERAELHILHSTSKSVTSALVGIAIDRGHIASTDVGFYSLFSYPNYQNWDERKDDMTLADVLTMQLGLEWDEWTLPYSNPDNGLVRLNNNHRDWARALLNLPMVSDPGTVFAYNTAATTAMGQAVENATGMGMAAFAQQYLFQPLQVTSAQWALSPTQLPIGGSGLYLTTRDLVKFGQLYLSGGEWQGQRVLSADYVAASVTPWADVSNIVSHASGYGYQWWLGELRYDGVQVEFWQTNGYGGQIMFIVPSLDLVVGFTGHNYADGQGINNLYVMMENYILDAL